MSVGRNPKRARKKERRNARREEWRRAVAKRRRQRWGVFLASLLVIALGAGIAWFAFLQPDETTPSASPGASAPSDAITAPVKEPVACGAKPPAAAGSKKLQYAEPDDQNLNPERVYLLTLKTSCGDILIDLDVKESPKTVNSVAFLARKQFYDGLAFHRIAPNFVIQGGDPQGDGTGGSGYDVVEPPPESFKYKRGVVAMAKGGADPAGTSGSQFFIVFGEGGSTLPPEYAVIGEVSDGMDVVDKIARTGGPSDGPPTEWTYIERATVSLKVGARAE